MGLSDASGVFGGPYLCAKERMAGGRPSTGRLVRAGAVSVGALVMLGFALIAKNIPKNQCHPRYWRQAAGPCRGGGTGQAGTERVTPSYGGGAFGRPGAMVGASAGTGERPPFALWGLPTGCVGRRMKCRDKAGKPQSLLPPRFVPPSCEPRRKTLKA